MGPEAWRDFSKVTKPINSYPGTKILVLSLGLKTTVISFPSYTKVMRKIKVRSFIDLLEVNSHIRRKHVPRTSLLISHPEHEFTCSDTIIVSKVEFSEITWR